MLATTRGATVVGIRAQIVDVQVDLSGSTSHDDRLIFVGLPDIAVRESRDRIRAAIRNSGYHFPTGKIIVNLAPAAVQKGGAALDLPIALGIMRAYRAVEDHDYRTVLFAGELRLDGGLRDIQGVLSIALQARRDGMKHIVVPAGNAREASMAEGISVWPVETLDQARDVLNSHSKKAEALPYQVKPGDLLLERPRFAVDFSDVRGHRSAKRALEVAAAGGHNILMIGPPGSGKTMLARRLPTILAPLTLEESLETTQVHSAAGILDRSVGLVVTRPFRAPHHTISDIGLIGGGAKPRPGEVSLSHNGVLFLDELPEFSRETLEAMRQPLESGRLLISRLAFSSDLPARFMLVAAMNPCPCGYFNAKARECLCTSPTIQRYTSKVSGPLLDRIDIHIEVPAVTYKDLRAQRKEETSEVIQSRVMDARRIQRARFALDQGTSFGNAKMTAPQVRRFCAIDGDCEHLLERAMKQQGLSARAHDRILKVARTIADLEGAPLIGLPHLAEAIQYRALDCT